MLTITAFLHTDAKMFKYKFNIDLNNVPQNVGRYHIHCPEHISKVHRIGVPGFKITKVDVPKINERSNVAFINFDCITLGRDLRVQMSSRDRNESSLVFYNKRNDDTYPFWVLGASNDPFLQLDFKVEGLPFEDLRNDEDGHRLHIQFAFSNPFLLPIVPLFPLFVLINSAEDKIFLKNVSNDLEGIDTQGFEKELISSDPRTWTMFSLYRLYIYFLYLKKPQVEGETTC